MPIGLRLSLAIAWLVVPIWVLGSSWDVLLAGHPAYLVLVLATLTVGIVLAARARKPREPLRCASHTDGHRRRHRDGRGRRDGRLAPAVRRRGARA